MSSLSLLVLSSPALAQTAGDCVGVSPTASPPASGVNILSDVTATPGQVLNATTQAGVFTPGSTVEYGVQPPVTVLGTVLAAPDGSATADVTVPAGLPDGDYAVFFRSAGVTPVDETVCVLPFTSTQPVAVLPVAVTKPPPPAARPAALPFTGSDAIIPLTIGGVALVGLGAGLVVVTRRRRRDAVSPTSLA